MPVERTDPDARTGSHGGQRQFVAIRDNGCGRIEQLLAIALRIGAGTARQNSLRQNVFQPLQKRRVLRICPKRRTLRLDIDDRWQTQAAGACRSTTMASKVWFIT